MPAIFQYKLTSVSFRAQLEKFLPGLDGGRSRSAQTDFKCWRTRDCEQLHFPFFYRALSKVIARWEWLMRLVSGLYRSGQERASIRLQALPMVRE